MDPNIYFHSISSICIYYFPHNLHQLCGRYSLLLVKQLNWWKPGRKLHWSFYRKWHGPVNVAINRTSHPRSRTWKAHKLPFDWKCCQARDCDKHCPDISPYWPFLQRTARQTSNVGLAHMRWLLQCSWTSLVLPSYVASNAGGTTPERSNAFRSSKQPHQVRSTHSQKNSLSNCLYLPEGNQSKIGFSIGWYWLIFQIYGCCYQLMVSIFCFHQCFFNRTSFRLGPLGSLLAAAHGSATGENVQSPMPLPASWR